MLINPTECNHIHFQTKTLQQKSNRKMSWKLCSWVLLQLKWRIPLLSHLPAIISARADQIAVIARKSHVSHVSRVAYVSLEGSLKTKTWRTFRISYRYQIIKEPYVLRISTYVLQWTRVRNKLTNFSVTGNSNNLTKPKSSPVASEKPLDERLAQLTSALSAFRGHTPITSLPRTLKCPQQIKSDKSNISLKDTKN